MEMEKLLKKIAKLEYHQSLLVEMLGENDYDFHKLVIKHSLSEEEVIQFYQLCDHLTMELEEQKAEGFMYFQPLYEKFKTSLHSKLNADEVIVACLRQKLYPTLMTELRKYTQS